MRNVMYVEREDGTWYFLEGERKELFAQGESLLDYQGDECYYEVWRDRRDEWRTPSQRSI